MHNKIIEKVDEVHVGATCTWINIAKHKLWTYVVYKALSVVLTLHAYHKLGHMNKLSPIRKVKRILKI